MLLASLPLPGQMLIPSGGCSAKCESLGAWAQRTSKLLLGQIDAGKRPGRDTAPRRQRFGQYCDPPTCTFLSRSSRLRVLGLLDLMEFRGHSAEVGVWQGEMSLAILKAFSSGRTHISIDPWMGHMGGCEALQDRHCAMRKLKNGSCARRARSRTRVCRASRCLRPRCPPPLPDVRRANPKKFQDMYEMVRDKLTAPYPTRAKVVRNFSLEASRLVPDGSLDFV